MNLLKEIINNSKKNYTHKINESAYIQTDNKIDNSYSSINELFLSLYDPNFSLLSSKEKPLYMKQKLLQIATDIDEKSREVYDNFNYNNKFKKNIIQRGLQLTNQLSTILYLNDLYNINSVLIFQNMKQYYKTSKKDKELIYINFDENTQKWSLGSDKDILECNLIEFDNLSLFSHIINNDVTTCDIYQNHLKSLSNYKIDDLHKIATNINIELKENGKKKTKKDLYDEINLYHLNLI